MVLENEFLHFQNLKIMAAVVKHSKLVQCKVKTHSSPVMRTLHIHVFDLYLIGFGTG